MASKLEQAVAIYRSLGYEETDMEHILELGIGSKEEQRIAKEGLKSGEWMVIQQISENSYGFVPVVDVDLQKLAIYAIRVGVDAKRAADVLRNKDEIGFRVIATRGEKFAADFIEAACVSSRRPWEHYATVFGMLIVNLVHRLPLDIPNSPEYIKDWSVYAANAAGVLNKDRNYNENFAPKMEEIKSRFCEHIEVGIMENVPATGPFSEVLLWGVQNQMLQRDAAVEHIFHALHTARRPGDRKAWMSVLDRIGLTDEEIIERGETLIPLLALGETPILEKFAPVLIASLSEDLLYPVLISCSSTKVQKTKKLILHAVLKRKKPKNAQDYAEWMDLYRNNEDKTIAKLASKLAKLWSIHFENEELPKEELKGLWQKTPKLWEVPRFELGEVSGERLTELASVLTGRKEFVGDIVFERFLAMANRLAYQNAEAARLSLAGIPANDSSGLGLLGSWARKKELFYSLDRERNIQRNGAESSSIEYSELFYARRLVLCASIDQLPCLLSMPSFEDLSIQWSDLADRLWLYKDENMNYCLESDFQLALTRLDTDISVDEEEFEKLQERLRSLDLKIQLPSGAWVSDESGNPVSAGEVLADYLNDPYIEPEFKPGETSYWRIDLELPKSLRYFPNRFSYNRNAMFSIFPHWGDFALTAVRRDFEVYHGQGVILRQVAKRKNPLPKGAMMNWLATQSYLSEENAEDVITATNEAWERGLLRSGIADIRYLDWYGKGISNLAKLVHSMECIAKERMLSIVWDAACALVEASLSAPRMLSGTAELVQFLRNYLNEVVYAVKQGIAPSHALEMRGVRKLADKKGNSKAVEYAREIVKRLDALDIALQISRKKDLPSHSSLDEKEQPTANERIQPTADIKTDLTEDTENNTLPIPTSTFDEIWKKLPSPKNLISDGISMQIKAVAGRTKDKIFRFDLKLPDISDYEFQVMFSGWLYGLENEGQIQASRVEIEKKNENPHSDGVWLHFDEDAGKMLVSEFRNWRGVNHSPLQGKPSTYSKTMLMIAVALLAQDGEIIYSVPRLVKNLIKSGDLSVESLREITRELLRHEDISPAKLVRVLEKDHSFLSSFWVMLTECIRSAGEKTEVNKKPPVWANRILDVCLYHAYYLKEAMNKGLISGKDAKWQGLIKIAECKAKSTAVEKAKKLAKNFIV